MEAELIRRERGIQGQEEESRITESRYNKKYRVIGVRSGDEGPGYLRKENLDKRGKEEGVRALVNLRCGNMEGINKF